MHTFSAFTRDKQIKAANKENICMTNQPTPISVMIDRLAPKGVEQMIAGKQVYFQLYLLNK